MLLKLRNLDYYKKWAVIGVILGIVVGISSLLIYYAIVYVTHLLLFEIAGYSAPTPLGEGGSLIYVYKMARPYMIPIILIAGGLLSGIIVYGLAPETEGHGTDAAISTFHNNNGEVRARVPFVKLVSAAITIGSGGSAGREGPTAQVSAGIGSIIGKFLDINENDKRLMTAIAVGSGIGAIFKAPFGGALLSAEVLYKRDMEVETIFPSIIASSIGFLIFGAFTGYNPIFGFNAPQIESILPFLFNAVGIITFIAIGFMSGLFSRLYIRIFYGIHDLFRKIKVNNMFKPAIGAAIMSVFALAFPQVLGIGYGWVQLMMSGNLAAFVNTYGMPLFVFFFMLAIVKIIATSLSIGSGGSGGVFAPGMFAGASFGVAIALIMHILLPSMISTIYILPLAIVSMLSFFGAAGKVPIAVTMMVSEMTGTLMLLPFAMISIAVAYIVSGEKSIYRSQVETRKDSPAHINDYRVPVLTNIRIKKEMLNEFSLSPSDKIYDAVSFMKRNSLSAIPVSKNNRLLGLLKLSDALDSTDRTKRISKIIDTKKYYIKLNDTAETALKSMIENGVMVCPVVENGKYMGFVRMRDILNAFESITNKKVGK